jgi:hypothetical protein
VPVHLRQWPEIPWHTLDQAVNPDRKPPGRNLVCRYDQYDINESQYKKCRFGRIGRIISITTLETPPVTLRPCRAEECLALALVAPDDTRRTESVETAVYRFNQAEEAAAAAQKRARLKPGFASGAIDPALNPCGAARTDSVISRTDRVTSRSAAQLVSDKA